MCQAAREKTIQTKYRDPLVPDLNNLIRIFKDNFKFFDNKIWYVNGYLFRLVI